MTPGLRRRLTLLGVLVVIAACRHGPPNVPPSIGLLKVATLGSHGGPGAFRAEPASVTRDARARYVVAVGASYNSTSLLFDSAGDFLDSLRSLGDTAEALRTPSDAVRERVATGRRDSTFWTARTVFSDSLELRDTAGHRLRAIAPNLSWFRPSQQAADTLSPIPPSPRITGLWRDASGRLWLLGRAVNPHWERGLAVRQVTPTTSVVDSIVDLARVYDVMIDEVDPDSGTVIAERRFSEFGGGLVIAPALLGVTRRDADGWWYVDVYYVMSNEGHD